VSIYEFLQQFVHDNVVLLTHYGIDTPIPYPQLAKVAQNFETTLQMSGEVSGFIRLINGKLAPSGGTTTGRFYAQKNTLSHAMRPGLQVKVDKGLLGGLPDPNEFFVSKTLGKYKNSFGGEYWVVEVNRSDVYLESGPFLLAVPVANDNGDRYEISSEHSKHMIRDYTANFLKQNSPESNGNVLIAQN